MYISAFPWTLQYDANFYEERSLKIYAKDIKGKHRTEAVGMGDFLKWGECFGDKSKRFLGSTIPGTTGVRKFIGYGPFSLGRSRILKQNSTCFKKPLAGITSLIRFRGSLKEKGFHGIECPALDSQAHPYIAMRFYFHRLWLTKRAWRESWLWILTFDSL